MIAVDVQNVELTFLDRFPRTSQLARNRVSGHMSVKPRTQGVMVVGYDEEEEQNDFHTIGQAKRTVRKIWKILVIILPRLDN